ncbi:MAG: hypothetical protein J5605_08875 [Bacteroidales bacterium]|nr:hypothetical protein [Bacteroidales bacterium]
MNAKELEKAQSEITNAIYDRAKKLGFDRYPITDGVCDFEGYLKSNPKIMWILKEPNGQRPNGKLEEGGWSIVEYSFRDDIEGTAKQPTWQTIIYVMYGYQNSLMYDDMEYIHNNIEMAKVMQRIAYLNVSKMPGYNTSYRNNIEQCYAQWKPILDRQIETYNPDVIIFGYTFDHFRNDFEKKGLEQIGNIPSWIDVYQSSNRILLDAYHPARKGREYINTLIEALNKYYPIIKNKSQQ